MSRTRRGRRYVQERAPDASHRATWREAFVTNAIRLVHPVREMRWPRGLPGRLHPPETRRHDVEGGGGGGGGGEGGNKEVVFHLPEAPGPITAAILTRVVSSLSADVGPRLPVITPKARGTVLD